MNTTTMKENAAIRRETRELLRKLEAQHYEDKLHARREMLDLFRENPDKVYTARQLAALTGLSGHEVAGNLPWSARVGKESVTTVYAELDEDGQPTGNRISFTKTRTVYGGKRMSR